MSEIQKGEEWEGRGRGGRGVGERGRRRVEGKGEEGAMAKGWGKKSGMWRGTEEGGGVSRVRGKGGEG